MGDIDRLCWPEPMQMICQPSHEPIEVMTTLAVELGVTWRSKSIPFDHGECVRSICLRSAAILPLSVCKANRSKYGKRRCQPSHSCFQTGRMSFSCLFRQGVHLHSANHLIERGFWRGLRGIEWGLFQDAGWSIR